MLGQLAVYIVLGSALVMGNTTLRTIITSSPAAMQRLAKAFWDGLRYYARGVYERAGEDNLFLKSGGIAYAFLICFVPMALVLFSVLGFVLEKSSIREALYTYVNQVIPYEGFAEQVKSFIAGRVDEFRLHRTWTGVVGLVGLLMASSGLFGAIRTTLNSVFRLDDALSTVSGKLRDIRLVLQALLLFLVSVIVLPLVDIALGYIGEIEALLGIDLGLVLLVVADVGSLLLVAIVYALAYYTIPKQKPPRYAIFASAVSAVVLLEVAKLAFGIYLDRAALMQRMYGAYLLTAALAMWIYYSSFVFVVSALIGRLVWERHDPQQHD
jgi:membrane protein